MKAMLRAHWPIVAIASTFAVLATIYSLVTPIFEASDEISHYPVIEHIATTGQLPIQQPGIETLWEQEGSQPPLYYIIGAALTFWIDTSDLETVRWRNPHAKLGIPLDPDNRNMVLHTDAESFPWQGTVLAVHLLRFFSVVLGTGTIVVIYLIALEVAPNNRWVAGLAAAIAAFNPMFLFITGSVNNDNLTILLSSLIILQCAKIIRTGLTPQRVLALALASGLASVTKISGLTLLPIVGLALLIYAYRRRDWKNTFYAGIAVAAACMLLAGWWYIRNLVLYSEILGLDTHVSIAGGREIGLLQLIQQEWYGFWVSYWALFGAVNILVDQPIYTFYATLSFVAVIGLIFVFTNGLRSKDWQSLLIPTLLITQIIVVLIGVIRWTMTTYASQGRLIFPAIGALSILTALGLMTLVPPRARLGISLAVIVPMFVIALSAPFVYIAPAYQQPTVISDLPSDALPIDAHFGDLSLLGASVSLVDVEEGERVPITLYWQAQDRIDENYSIYIHALGRDNTEIGKIDAYPGAGTLPTSQMESGLIYVDHYSVELDPDFVTPTSIRFLIGAGIYNSESFEAIAPTSSDGSQRADVIIDAAAAYPSDFATCTAPDQSPTASFGGFALLWAENQQWSASQGEVIDINLAWNRMAATPTDWTVFVHLYDSAHKRVTQADGPPIGGFYPTSHWLRPCYFTDVHQLEIPADLPAGTYEIFVGLYDPADPNFVRAVAADASGQPYPDFAVPIGTVEVGS